MFEDIDPKQQRSATTRHKIIWILACCEETVKEKKYFSGQSTVSYFKSYSETCTSPPLCLDVGYDNPVDPPTDDVPLPKVVACLSFIIFFKFFLSTNISLLFVKTFFFCNHLFYFKNA